MKNFFSIVIYFVLIGLIVFSIKVDKKRRTLTYQNKHLSEKLERYEARYEAGDLEHTVKFTHSCGHEELFSLNKVQANYLMQLKAHSCFECNNEE
mgnify:FL=1